MKRTNIICTIGPASEKIETLTAMVKQGMNVARLNFSHGSYENHAMLIKNIRLVSSKLNIPIAILQDLQGPKIRVKQLPAPISVKAGQKLILGKDFDLDYDVYSSVKVGEHILIEDGLTILKIVSIKGKHVVCRAENSGAIQSHKGVNLPDSRIAFPIFTKKDIADLKFGLTQDVDFVALSFVRDSADVVRLKKMIKQYLPTGQTAPKVIAKIERKEALEDMQNILKESDAIMVARGDLGVEMSDSIVPVAQKNIINMCIQAAKPVIVATQMLDSMIHNPRPTRAEVSDVANAVIDKADCVMLSGETAFGKYPVETVAEMSRIIGVTELSPYALARSPYSDEFTSDLSEARATMLAYSAYDLAEQIGAAAIIGTTESGFTARFISQQRPDMPIFLVTDNPKVYRQMCLNWGVRPLYVKSMSGLKQIKDLLDYLINEAKTYKVVKRGDEVVLIAGNPLGQRMNLVYLSKVK